MQRTAKKQGLAFISWTCVASFCQHRDREPSECNGDILPPRRLFVRRPSLFIHPRDSEPNTNLPFSLWRLLPIFLFCLFSHHVHADHVLLLAVAWWDAHQCSPHHEPSRECLKGCVCVRARMRVERKHYNHDCVRKGGKNDTCNERQVNAENSQPNTKYMYLYEYKSMIRRQPRQKKDCDRCLPMTRHDSKHSITHYT